MVKELMFYAQLVNVDPCIPDFILDGELSIDTTPWTTFPGNDLTGIALSFELPWQKGMPSMSRSKGHMIHPIFRNIRPHYHAVNIPQIEWLVQPSLCRVAISYLPPDDAMDVSSAAAMDNDVIQDLLHLRRNRSTDQLEQIPVDLPQEQLKRDSSANVAADRADDMQTDKLPEHNVLTSVTSFLVINHQFNLLFKRVCPADMFSALLFDGGDLQAIHTHRMFEAREIPMCVAVNGIDMAIKDSMFKVERTVSVHGLKEYRCSFHGAVINADPQFDVETRTISICSNISIKNIVVLTHRKRMALWKSIKGRFIGLNILLFEMRNFIQRGYPVMAQSTDVRQGGIDLVLYDFVNSPFSASVKTPLHNPSQCPSIVLVSQKDFDQIEDTTVMDLIGGLACEVGDDAEQIDDAEAEAEAEPDIPPVLLTTLALRYGLSLHDQIDHNFFRRYYTVSRDQDPSQSMSKEILDVTAYQVQFKSPVAEQLMTHVKVTPFPRQRAIEVFSEDECSFFKKSLINAQTHPETLECPICTTAVADATNPVATPLLTMKCGHVICLDCCVAWSRARTERDQKFICPSCRCDTPLFGGEFLLHQNFAIAPALVCKIHALITRLCRRGRLVIVDPNYLLHDLMMAADQRRSPQPTHLLQLQPHQQQQQQQQQHHQRKSTLLPATCRRNFKHLSMMADDVDARTIPANRHVYMTGPLIRAGVYCKTDSILFTDRCWFLKHGGKFLGPFSDTSMYVLMPTS